MKTILHSQRHKSTRWLCDGVIPLWGRCRCRTIPQAVGSAQWGRQGLPTSRRRGAGAPHLSKLTIRTIFPLESVAGRSKAVSMRMAVSPRCHGDGDGRPQAGGGRARTVSPRHLPRAVGTSNPASLHFTPLRSTKELSNNQLGGNELALGGMQCCLLLLLTP